MLLEPNREIYKSSDEFDQIFLLIYRLGFERNCTTQKPRRVAIKSINKKKIPLNKGAASDVMNEVHILSKF